MIVCARSVLISGTILLFGIHLSTCSAKFLFRNQDLQEQIQQYRSEVEKLSETVSFETAKKLLVDIKKFKQRNRIALFLQRSVKKSIKKVEEELLYLVFEINVGPPGSFINDLKEQIENNNWSFSREGKDEMDKLIYETNYIIESLVCAENPKKYSNELRSLRKLLAKIRKIRKKTFDSPKLMALAIFKWGIRAHKATTQGKDYHPSVMHFIQREGEDLRVLLDDIKIDASRRKALKNILEKRIAEFSWRIEYRKSGIPPPETEDVDQMEAVMPAQYPGKGRFANYLDFKQRSMRRNLAKYTAQAAIWIDETSFDIESVNLYRSQYEAIKAEHDRKYDNPGFLTTTFDLYDILWETIYLKANLSKPIKLLNYLQKKVSEFPIRFSRDNLYRIEYLFSAYRILLDTLPNLSLMSQIEKLDDGIHKIYRTIFRSPKNGMAVKEHHRMVVKEIKDELGGDDWMPDRETRQDVIFECRRHFELLNEMYIKAEDRLSMVEELKEYYLIAEATPDNVIKLLQQ